jgi:hypothetical protein
VGLTGEMKSSMTIDKNCLSCLSSSGNQQEKSRVLNAFKLACLSYSPSPVTFELEEHKRSDFLSLVQQELANISLL